MYKLAIGADDARALEVCPVVVLHGPGIAAPAKGCFYEQPGGSGETVEDQLDLQVDGTPAEIAGLQSQLEQRFELARQAGRAVFGSRPRVYLLGQALAGESQLRSLVLDGWCEKLKGDRAKGSQVLRLHVRRVNSWEGPEAWATISNRYGLGAAGTFLQVDNRSDSTHDNFIDLGASAVAGDLPARCRLEMAGGGALAGAFGTVMVGADLHVRPGWEVPHVLECESMPGTGSTTVDANMSGGQYRSCTWVGEADSEVLRLTLTANQVERFAGKDLRPVLRTVGALGMINLWMRVMLYQGASLIAEHPWVLLTAGQELHELPSIRIPPQVLTDSGSKYFGEITIAVRVRRATAGSHTLPVDYLQLTPLDGWRKLVSRANGCALTAALHDDGFTGVVTVLDGTTVYSDYVGYGDQVRLVPGQKARLYFLLQRNSDKTADGRRGLMVRIAYRPTWRRI